MNRPDAILISSIPNIIYETGFSGFSDNTREAFVLLTENKKYIITDKRYSEAVEKNTKGFEIINTGAVNFLSNDAKVFFKQTKIKTLGIETSNITVAEYSLLRKTVKISSYNINKNRIIKTNDEVKNIKKACRIGDLAFDHLLKKIKVGITENQISDELINFFKSNDADSSFKPIVAFGSHSSIPHHNNTDKKLKKNQIILLDFGVKFNNYCSDMSRTIYFGNPDKRFIEIYNTVWESQQKAIDFVNTNTSKKIKLSEIDKIAREYIISQGFETIPHALGHGIGLEVHESPTLSPKSADYLQNNTIFSIEPGIYISNYGGVRIEDLVLVRNMKLELISHANREIIAIHD